MQEGSHSVAAFPGLACVAVSYSSFCSLASLKLSPAMVTLDPMAELALVWFLF